MKPVLYKYPLEYSKTLLYLKDHLQGVNLLSNMLCSHVPFQEGVFYTFSRREVLEKQLHEFQYGGSLTINSVETCQILVQELEEHPSLFYAFDDFNTTYEPNYTSSLFSEVGCHYKEEVYYVVAPPQISLEILENCLDCSHTLWHSLCVGSKSAIHIKEDRNLTELEFIAFAKNAHIILIGAYDAEGQIFWKRQS